MSATDGGAELVTKLIELRRQRKTGTLTIDAGGARTWVSLEHGVPVFAEGGARGDELGSVLRDEGLIDDETFRTIVQRMTDAFVDNETLRFGQIAVMLGFLDTSQITYALAAQLERKLLVCMGQREVDAVFHEDPEATRDLPTSPCDVEALVLSALGSVFDPPRVQAILGPRLMGYLRLEAPVPVLIERLRADDATARLLRAVDGTRPTADVMVATGMEATHAAQLVTALLLLGLATAPQEPSRAAMGREDTGRVALPRARPEPHPAAKSPTPAPTRPSPEAQARRARLVAARLSHLRNPASVTEQAEADSAGRRAAAKASAAAIAERFARTHGTQPGANLATGPAQAEPAVQRDLRLAFTLVLQGDYRRAEPMLAELEAATTGDERSHCSFARRFSEMQSLNDARGKAAIARGLAKEAKRLLRQDKRWALGHFILGQLRLAEGDEEGAARSFKNAAKLEPGDIHIQRFHRILQRRVRH